MAQIAMGTRHLIKAGAFFQQEKKTHVGVSGTRIIPKAYQIKTKSGNIGQD